MNEAEHRRAFEELPDKHHESPEYGMMPPETPWESPDGDVVLERVPDFEQGQHGRSARSPRKDERALVRGKP